MRPNKAGPVPGGFLPPGRSAFADRSLKLFG